MLYRFGGKAPTVGERAYVSDSALVIGDVVIGDHCYVGHGAILRGDYGRIVIGEGSAVEEGVILHAPPGEACEIGRRVTMGHGAIVHAKAVGAEAVIGMGAILSIRSVVGEGAIVAEGCIVKLGQEIPAGVVVAGNPAKVVREVSAKDRDFWTYGKELYIDLAHRYLDEVMEPV